MNEKELHEDWYEWLYQGKLGVGRLIDEQTFDWWIARIHERDERLKEAARDIAFENGYMQGHSLVVDLEQLLALIDNHA